MLGRGQVIAGVDELLGPGDPAALAARLGAGVFAAGRALIGQRVVIIAPRDPVGVGEMGRGGGGGIAGGGNRLRSHHAVGSRGKSHARDQPLQDLHRIAPGVHIHVENAGLHRVGQFRQARAAEVMLDENLLGLGAGQRLDVLGVDAPVLVQIQPQGLHRPDGDAKVGGTARIVGIVHVTALSRDDLRGDFFNAWHGTLVLQVQAARVGRTR